MTDHVKLPFGLAFNQAAQQKIKDAIQLEGKSLPCSVTAVKNGAVKVKFEIQSSTYTLPPVWLPVAESLYVRLPIQKGDLGVVRPADAYIGNVSGLGGGVSTLLQRGNLSTLVFEPVSNAGWPAVNPNQVYVRGPGGAVLGDLAGTATITASANSLILAAGGHEIVINSSGIFLDGKQWATHEHTGVQSGASNTGGVA